MIVFLISGIHLQRFWTKNTAKLRSQKTDFEFHKVKYFEKRFFFKNKISKKKPKEFPGKPNETNHPVRLIKKWQTVNKKVYFKSD